MKLIKTNKQVSKREAQKIERIFLEFNKAKIKEKSFAKRLAIVTQMLDNLFRIEKKQPLISFLKFRSKKIIVKAIKNIKKIKKCKRR
jgi:hypothetical protein